MEVKDKTLIDKVTADLKINTKIKMKILIMKIDNIEKMHQSFRDKVE